MRSLLFALLALPCGAGTTVLAQEPLLLHIRPNDASLPERAGTGETVSDEDVAARARAAREAVWQRAERRARMAIASVCTGCLPAPPVPSRPATSAAETVRAAETASAFSNLPKEGDL